MVRNFAGRIYTLVVVGFALLCASPAAAQNEVVVPVPYSQKNPDIPHPVHKNARTTLKAYVRDTSCGTYRISWDVNRNGNYDDDWSRDVSPDGNATLWEIGRTYIVPSTDLQGQPLAQDTTLNISVRVRNLCNGTNKYGTYRMFVYNWDVSDDPRQWTAEQLEILQVEAVDEGMWFNHRTLVNRGGRNTNSITGQCPFTEGTGLYLWLYNINGHLPAYPPGTYTYPANDPPPAGFIEENNRRWAVDPYAETAVRLMNDLTAGANLTGVNAIDEDNTCGYGGDPHFPTNQGYVLDQEQRCNRIAGTADSRGAYSSRGAGTYQMGINGGAIATCLPSMAGTRIQNGPLAGNRFEWFAQQMTDLLGWMQLDGGSAYGSWYYHNVDLPNEQAGSLTNPCYGTTCGAWAVYSDMSTTQWAFVGMDGIEEAGHDYGITISNRHKYRVAEQLRIAQRDGNGGVTYANNYSEPDMKLTGGAILGARWIGLHSWATNDGSRPYRPYTQFSKGELRQVYDRYINFAATWWAQRRVHGTHWLDGLWAYGDYLCGDTSGLYSQGTCGNTYGIYSHQKGYRTGLPQVQTVGGRDWNREFSTYYVRAMTRNIDAGNPLAGYDTFGQIVDSYCDIWGVTCGYGPGYFGSVMGHLVLTPTLFHPKPVPIAKVDQTEVFAGCAGGTNGKVIFDHSESFHPNFAARIVRYQWDVNASNGLWWDTNSPPDYQTPGADGVLGQIFEYSYNSPGNYRATLRVIDDAGEHKTSFVDVRVLANPNTPPGAVAGPPYVIEENEALALMGNAFDANSACGDVITASWDFNNDNTFGDGGINRADGLVPWATISALPRGVPNRIRLKVRDAAGLEVIAETTLTIWPSLPQAVLRINPTPARCGETVFFDGSRSGSSNPLRQIVRYDWDVDGRPGFDGLGPVFEYTYPAFGSYPITLRVTDDRGRTATANGTVEVNLGNQAPVARISQPVYTVLSGEDLRLDATRSADPNETCGDRIVTYKWDLDGNGQYNDAGDVTGVNPNLPWQFLSARMRWPASRETNQPANPIRLLVTDTFGLSSTAEATIIIYDATPIADFQQTPSPAPINVRTGEVRPFLDGRASRSPIAGVSITRVDWDVNDDGQFEVVGRETLQASRFIAPVPDSQEDVPEMYMRIRVTDSTGRTATKRQLVHVHMPPTPPTADADPSDVPEQGYNLLLGETLTLNGAGSFDPDAADFGDFVNFYRWDLNFQDGAQFVADITREDQNSDAVEAVVPLTIQEMSTYGITNPGQYTVKLQVEDTTGMTNFDTAPVTIHPVNPQARFTMDANNIACGDRVTLDARSSFHPHPLIRIDSYLWDLDNDGQYDDAEGAVVQARYDQFTYGQAKTLRLRITDSLGRTATASAQLLVDLGNVAPSPVAGGNRDANGNVIGPYVKVRGEALQLSAAGSFDANEDCGDRIVRYQWDVKNDGSYEFDRQDNTVPLITAAQLNTWGMQNLGTYDIRLRVTDRFGVTADQVVPFRVVNGPTAIVTATPARVACNAQVTFDGSASFTDGPLGQGFDLVEFLWDLDNDGQYDDASGVRTSRNAFALPDAQGNVTMTPRLQIRDVSGRTVTASAVVVINPQNLAPIASAGGPYTTGPVAGGFQAITLDGRASYDPDEPCDALTAYKWDIDGDGRFGNEDAPAEPMGAQVANFVSPLWQPNTTQTVRLKVCDMRNTCSKIDEADVQIRPAAPPAGRMLAPLAADAACMGQGAFDVRFEVGDPGGRPVTATVNIAGIDVGTSNFNPPANGAMIPGTIRVDPVARNIPEGRHLIIVKFRNNAGGESKVDAGDRIVFDRTAPTLTVGAQLAANACYAPSGVPRPTVDAQDFWDPVPNVSTVTTSDVCSRTFRVTARDACGNSTVVERSYFVAEAVPVTITGPDDGALVNSAQISWTVPGAQQCHPLVTSTLSRDGAAAQAYLANAPINNPGTYVYSLTVSDCLNQVRPYGRRFTVNAPPVAVPVPTGHPQADTGRAATYRVKQGDQLIVDASDSRAPEAFDQIASYAWDWTGDGTVDANTVRALYPTPAQGTFDGRLTVTDSVNASNSAPFRVVIDDVSPACNAGGPYVIFSKNQFTADGSNSRPGAANEPITRYVWDWDDANPDSEGVRANHTYTDSGNYFLRLTCHDQDSTSTSTVRVDVRDVSPIVTRFTPPAVIYEVIPQQWSVEAIPALENDPISAYEWDWGDDNINTTIIGTVTPNQSEYRGLDKATVVHQIREYGNLNLAVRVYDTDTRGIRKYPIVVREATFTVLLEHLRTKIAAAVANPAYNAQQKLSLLDAGTYITRALWGERYLQRGVTLQALDTLTTKMVQAQLRGVDFGTELWAFARQASRELNRMETTIKAIPGVNLRDADLVAGFGYLRNIEQYKQAAWEAKVRSQADVMVAVDNWSKVLEGYFYLRRYSMPLKMVKSAPTKPEFLNVCNINEAIAPRVALKGIVNPITRAEEWGRIKSDLAAGLDTLVSDLEIYVNAGAAANDPGPDRNLVQLALQQVTEAAAIAADPIGRICGSGQTCVSEPKEVRYVAQLNGFAQTMAQLRASGAYTRLWQGIAERAVECRTLLSHHETVDVNANGNYLGGFPVKTVDQYFFTVASDTETLFLETSDGRGGCPASIDTQVTLFKINGNSRATLGLNNDISAVRKCSRLERQIVRGLYEVKVERPGALAGIDMYNLLVTHTRTDGCSDRRVGPGEECDDGNLDNGDGCSALCKIEATPIDAGGDFPGGFAANEFDRFGFTLPIRRTVTLNVTDGAGGCPGDARMVMTKIGLGGLPAIVATDDDSGPGPCPVLSLELDPGRYEVKVDGINGVSVDPYVLTAAFIGACGDGTVDPGEGCDDRNRQNADGCSAVCTLEDLCGNGAVDSGELCDDGNRANGDGCDLNCKPELGAVCGNGRAEVGEGCDDGNRLNGDGCSADCVREPQCGNRIIDVGEQCDDANVRPGDGCSPTCQREVPCGNTKVNAGEQCDDGNVNNGDGCNSTCQIEATHIDVAQTRLRGAIVARGAAWYTFRAEALSTLYAETSDGAGGCTFDTALTLFRKSGASVIQVARDDDSGPERCSRLAPRIGAGDYMMRVDVLNGVALPAFTLDFRLDTNISTGGVFGGGFAEDGSDMFYFTIAAMKHGRFQTGDGQGGCPGDTIMSLRRRNPDGTRPEVGSNDDNEGTCSLIALDLPPATYELVVTGRGAINDYKLLAQIAAPVGSCGNSQVEGAEECDDGNRVVGDGCDLTCRYECGNRRVDANETCDDGNRVAGDGCSDVCRNEGTCGNGIAEVGEACDDGNQVGGDGCEANCTLRAGCGNRIIGVGETCDDGNLVNGDGCDVLCSTELTILDKATIRPVGAIPAGQRDVFRFKTEDESVIRLQTSDGGAGCPGNTVLRLFQIGAGGARNEIASDDDGGNNGCSLLTRELPVGNFEAEVHAPADRPLLRYTLDYRLVVSATQSGGYSGGFEKAGNDLFTLRLEQDARIIFETSDGLGGCPGDTIATLYQNGRVLQSDDNNGPGSCSRIYYPNLAGAYAPAGDYEILVVGRNNVAVRAYAAYASYARCGDSVVTLGEQCDDGNAVAGDGCDATCRLENLCGNNRIDAGETCDDGNRNNGDGCSSACQREVLCGNGHVDPGEQCDDGNVEAGDGCSANCQAEEPACGNNVVEGAEQCDDGNRNAGDGCSADCTIEQVCGNSILEGAETCDDGNAVDGDGCSAACQREFFPIIGGTYSRSSTLARNVSDVFRFTADARANLKVETKTGVVNGVSECAAIDTELLLYSINALTGAKTLVASNDDARAGYRCSLISRSINPGRYELIARGKLGAQVPEYIFDFRMATNITTAAIYGGAFVAEGHDLYELRTAQAARYTITTSDGGGGCPGDTVFTFYRIEANGTRTAITPPTADDDGPGLCSQISSFQTVANVLYELEVSGKNGIAIGSYRLQTQLR
jgi:cysteine-rich repeat protein